MTDESRRSFLKLSTTAAPAMSAALVIREPDKPPAELDVTVLRLQPGDVLVLTAPGSIPAATAERITQYLEQYVTTPLGVRALVFGDGLTVAGILRTK
jgi:hypothetical protein